MLNLYPTHIESLSIHRVGNKSRNEGVFLSEVPYTLNDEITGLLKEYFFKPFREKEENYYRFDNEVDVEFNELFKIASEILKILQVYTCSQKKLQPCYLINPIIHILKAGRYMLHC